MPRRRTWRSHARSWRRTWRITTKLGRVANDPSFPFGSPDAATPVSRRARDGQT
jgi:hypothetical protein